MNIKALSLSLNVSDIEASRVFYEKLGFSADKDTQDMDYLVMRNGGALICLFQDYQNENMISIYPEYTDFKSLHQEVIDKGIEIEEVYSEDKTVLASFVIRDPDGNAILIEEHNLYNI